MDYPKNWREPDALCWSVRRSSLFGEGSWVTDGKADYRGIEGLTS